jgi:hypothetical protein
MGVPLAPMGGSYPKIETLSKDTLKIIGAFVRFVPIQPKYGNKVPD